LGCVAVNNTMVVEEEALGLRIDALLCTIGCDNLAQLCGQLDLEEDLVLSIILQFDVEERLGTRR